MRRNTAIKMMAILMLILVFLCSCQQNGSNNSIKETIVVVTMDCSDIIYGVEFEYYIDRNSLGGQAVSRNLEMSEPLVDKTFRVRFDERGFSNPDDLQNGTFGIVVYVVLDSGASNAVRCLFEWKAEYGKEYHFVLSGNRESGFTFTPAESDTKYTVTPFSELPEELV